ncbi:hypothetical protein [Streptomyces sp. NPDC101776]|uniref:hypothetical protein n=1 Tax=Streptomyces sp. NPDC101776 TaxID=3366146 RepID=UPI00381E6074
MTGARQTKSLRALRRCLTELDVVLPLLTEAEEVRYYERLHRLATLTAQPHP